MTGVRSIAEAAAPTEQVFRRLLESGGSVDPVSLDLLSGAIDAVEARLDRLPQSGAEISSLRDIGAAARSLVSRAEQRSAVELEEAGGGTTEPEVSEAAAFEAEPPEPEASEAEREASGRGF